MKPAVIFNTVMFTILGMQLLNLVIYTYSPTDAPEAAKMSISTY